MNKETESLLIIKIIKIIGLISTILVIVLALLQSVSLIGNVGIYYIPLLALGMLYEVGNSWYKNRKLSLAGIYTSIVVWIMFFIFLMMK